MAVMMMMMMVMFCVFGDVLGSALAKFHESFLWWEFFSVMRDLKECLLGWVFISTSCSQI